LFQLQMGLKNTISAGKTSSVERKSGPKEEIRSAAFGGRDSKKKPQHEVKRLERGDKNALGGRKKSCQKTIIAPKMQQNERGGKRKKKKKRKKKGEILKQILMPATQRRSVTQGKNKTHQKDTPGKTQVEKYRRGGVRFARGSHKVGRAKKKKKQNKRKRGNQTQFSL